MTSHPHTYRLFQTIWEIPEGRRALLGTFFRWVDEGASRQDIDANLKTLFGKRGSAEFAFFQRFGIDTEQVHWSRLTEFLCACFYALRSGSPLPELPADIAWDAEPTETDPGILTIHPQRDRPLKWTVPLALLPLEQKLLAFGDERLVYIGEPDLVPLLERGEMFEGPARLMPGRPRHCHANAAKLWATHKDEFVIATGYGLSEDGLWRQHSFLLRKHPTPRQRRLIETTVPRVRYFGFLLSEQEAEAFAYIYGQKRLRKRAQ